LKDVSLSKAESGKDYVKAQEQKKLENGLQLKLK
jgi:3-hydroxyacyl-CoA dehydrogenase/enoyl-CoA hydratase/3-hydroxybutyryl-CoA epimerase